MRVPLFNRLGSREWPYLILSLNLLLIEQIITLITSFLPETVILWFRSRAKSVLQATKGPSELDAEPELGNLVRKLGKASGFVEMCEIFGYQAEEHIVRTTDGYLLGVHRIGGPKESRWRKESGNYVRPIVYLHHGLLMNSEIWVCNVDPRQSLPFMLAEMGYDVWLGNNRGNKYSKKHISRRPDDPEFWNFSIDEFAFYDIPDTIDYILNCTGQKELTYIGFSQGSAQGFAALSINPQLNRKVKLFIAISPAMAPPNLGNSIVNSLMCASPSLMYLFFGRKIIMKSAAFWQLVMLPALYVRIIDWSVDSLFKWKCLNITYPQKLASYAHLYSYTSVKTVVHWFQIIKNKRFHLFDDDMGRSFGTGSSFYRAAPFPTKNIMTPIVLIYGKSDSLVDIKCMLSELPDDAAAVGIPNHEHLDMIWGKDVDSLIFPYIFSALRRVNGVKERTRRRSSGASSIKSKSSLAESLEKVSGDKLPRVTADIHQHDVSQMVSSGIRTKLRE